MAATFIQPLATATDVDIDFDKDGRTSVYGCMYCTLVEQSLTYTYCINPTIRVLSP